MKLRTVLMISAVGMLSSSAGAYVMTDRPTARVLSPGLAATADVKVSLPAASRFVAGETVRVEGRLAHEQLAADGRRETYLLLEMTATQAKTAQRAPVNIALVIDRSGSMAAGRIDNAKRAAAGLVGGLSDGDVVSVISFDTATRVEVPATTVDASSRRRIVDKIRGIALGGDTCMSCGIERARQELASTTGKVDRMIVLSDGKANHGVRDVPGLARIAEAAREADLAITTVGLGFDYNEQTLARLASASNGAHHFVPEASALDAVFQAEAEAVLSTVASEAMAEIELAPGVELLEVVDREHRREGTTLRVPLGAFSGGARKTVLLRVRAPSGATDHATMASTTLRYRDLTAGGVEAMTQGALAVPLAERDAPMDPLVSLRLQRRRTGDTLRDAADLFTRGRLEEARRMLEDNRRSLDQARQDVASSGDGRAREIDEDLVKQQADTEASLKSLKKAKKTKGKKRRGYVLDNVQMMNPYSI